MRNDDSTSWQDTIPSCTDHQTTEGVSLRGRALGHHPAVSQDVYASSVQGYVQGYVQETLLSRNPDTLVGRRP